MRARAPGTVQSSLGTRVAVRTFVLFALTSALPVVLFAFIGWFFVADELETAARSRLGEASKRYGIALNERLIQAEALMIEAARVELESPDGEGGGSSLLARMQILTPLMEQDAPIAWRDVLPSEVRLPAGWKATRALQADVSGGVGRVRLLVNVTDGRRTLELVVDPTDRAFWDIEQVLPNGRVCVFVGGQPLHCDSGDASLREFTDFTAAEWDLFLKPRFGAATWTVRVEQPRGIALASVRAFKITLPLVAAIAIVGALLLSFTHLRRIHAPLAKLVAAARRMSRGRFGEPLRIAGDDEFASVGRAFNRLAERLKRQLGLMSAMARIDRQILARPTFEPVVLTLLPRIPRLIGCLAAAVVLDAGKDEPRQLLLYRAKSGKGVELGRVGAGEAPDEALRRACGARLEWLALPIEVEGHQRGVLLTGYPVGAPARRNALRSLRGMAHRLAVALGNEDRERALLRQAYFDTLTGLPNRQLFIDRLDQELLRSGRESRCVSLLYIDLDHFKHLNDSLGHSVGDGLLHAVAQRLGGNLPEGLTLSRLGGDEFTILCPSTSADQAEAVAARTLQQLRAPFDVGGRNYVINASIGIAEFPRDATASAEMLRCANAAMHRAKQMGRGRIAHFEESIDVKAQRRLTVEQRLRAALDRNELSVAFQPKFDTVGSRVVGFEALARWTDPELGVVSPAEFIPVAEESGLVGRVGAMALVETCRRLAEWRAQGGDAWHVAVNVSVHQLRDAQFPSFVARNLEAAGLPSSVLHLEITESVLAIDDDRVIDALAQLRATGIHIAMDDFGTGYSSLASLRDLPIDVLKIDRSFVVRCCDSRADEALLRGVIELAHTLGKTVVAEGVETRAQLDLLCEFGCDVVQGYLLGRPMAAGDVPGFLSRAALTVSSAPSVSSLPVAPTSAAQSSSPPSSAQAARR